MRNSLLFPARQLIPLSFVTSRRPAREPYTIPTLAGIMHRRHRNFRMSEPNSRVAPELPRSGLNVKHSITDCQAWPLHSMVWCGQTTRCGQTKAPYHNQTSVRGDAIYGKWLIQSAARVYTCACFPTSSAQAKYDSTQTIRK